MVLRKPVSDAELSERASILLTAGPAKALNFAHVTGRRIRRGADAAPPGSRGQGANGAWRAPAMSPSKLGCEVNATFV